MLRRFLIGSIAVLSVLGAVFAFAQDCGPVPPKGATAIGAAEAVSTDRAAPLGGQPDPRSRTSVTKAKPAGTTSADFTRQSPPVEERWSTRSSIPSWLPTFLSAPPG